MESFKALSLRMTQVPKTTDPRVALHTLVATDWNELGQFTRARRPTQRVRRASREVPKMPTRLNPRIAPPFANPGIDIVSQMEFGLKPFRLDFASRRSLTVTARSRDVGVSGVCQHLRRSSAAPSPTGTGSTEREFGQPSRKAKGESIWNFGVGLSGKDGRQRKPERPEGAPHFRSLTPFSRPMVRTHFLNLTTASRRIPASENARTGSPRSIVAGAAVPKSLEATSFQDFGADLPVGPLVRESQHARSLTS